MPEDYRIAIDYLKRTYPDNVSFGELEENTIAAASATEMIIRADDGGLHPIISIAALFSDLETKYMTAAIKINTFPPQLVYKVTVTELAIAAANLRRTGRLQAS